MKKNKALGPILGVIFVAVIMLIGYMVGRYVADQYNKKHGTTKNIFEILKIENSSVPINYVLKDNSKTLTELCQKSTGICDQEVGVLSLDNMDIKLYIYSNFDNPDDLSTTYFKFNNKKIGSFVYLDKFEIFDKKYLIVTEPNSYNNNYVIHIYDNSGKELAAIDANNINNGYEIKNNELYFYSCNGADSSEVNGEMVPKVTYYKVMSTDVVKKEVISSEYRKCI